MSQRNYLNGLAAEDIAERIYRARGHETLAKRYRSEAGEIDLITRIGDVVVFTEVKARRTRDQAAHAIRPAQWQRIMTSAELYIDAQNLNGIDLRFDAALIDQSGTCEIIENAAQF